MDACKLLEDIWFWVCDFDMTLARTFDPSPNQIDVYQGYNLAIKYLFGSETFGLDPLQLIGGLQNRAPSEVIAALFEHKQELIEQAREIFNRQKDVLSDFVPIGKGVPLVWDDTQANWNPLRIISELLVRAKLIFLINEIGPAWPLPCNGLREFLQNFPTLKKKNQIKLQLAILSSGHEEFIKKVFTTWELPCPELIITDDDLRGLHFPDDPKKTVKPSPFLLDLVFRQWFKRQEYDLATIDLSHFLMAARQKTIYFGDDPQKDGQLAKNAGVRFGWYNPEQKHAANLGEHFCFTDWQQVPGLLGLA
ncbi:MAG: hypothetical protein NTX00_05525 [Candidatus Parcubacteria bacterium]|nr:hypothetical protein [Candidatus Parcubacteria bacterium]